MPPCPIAPRCYSLQSGVAPTSLHIPAALRSSAPSSWRRTPPISGAWTAAILRPSETLILGASAVSGAERARKEVSARGAKRECEEQVGLTLIKVGRRRRALVRRRPDQLEDVARGDPRLVFSRVAGLDRAVPVGDVAAANSLPSRTGAPLGSATCIERRTRTDLVVGSTASRKCSRRWCDW